MRNSIPLIALVALASTGQLAGISHAIESNPLEFETVAKGWGGGSEKVDRKKFSIYSQAEFDRVLEKMLIHVRGRLGRSKRVSQSVLSGQGRLWGNPCRPARSHSKSTPCLARAQVKSME